MKRKEEPTALALEQATELKTLAREKDASPEPPVNLEDVLQRKSLHPTFVSTASIRQFGDTEYTCFLNPGKNVTVHCDLDSQLLEWLDGVSTERLARILDKVFDGVGGTNPFKFTGSQRLNLAYHLRPFFDVTASYSIDEQQLRTINPMTNRKLPIRATFWLKKHHLAKVLLCNLQTGGGKTAFTVALSFLMLSDFEELKKSYMRRIAGSLNPGSPELKMPRLVIIAAIPQTFHHFENTVHGLAEKLDPTINLVVWNTIGKRCNTTEAFSLCQRDPHAIVAHIVPLERLVEVLRYDITITVPVVIVDEFVVDTPRAKFSSQTSEVVQYIVAQATPHLLQKATGGHGSFMKDFFGGQLFPPKTIPRLTRHSQFKDAQVACEQAAKLRLITMSPTLCDMNVKQLARISPCGISMQSFPSKRQSLGALVNMGGSDVVPVDFASSIRARLKTFYPDRNSVCLLDHALSSSCSIQHLANTIARLTSDNPRSYAIDRDRLVDKLREYEGECPICCEDTPTDLHVYPCCGFCSCKECFRHSPARCPNCRSFCRSEIRVTEMVETAVRLEDERYPTREQYLAVDMRNPSTLRNNSMLCNLSMAIYYLLSCGKKKIFIAVEKPRHSSLQVHEDLMNLSRIEENTGVRMLRIDKLLTGKGSGLSRAKDEFDGARTPIALVSIGIEKEQMVGIDLCEADAVVVVGIIDTSIVTQAINRTLRPNEKRGNGAIMQITVGFD